MSNSGGWMYSDAVLEHFKNPKNILSDEDAFDADGTGKRSGLHEIRRCRNCGCDEGQAPRSDCRSSTASHRGEDPGECPASGEETKTLRSTLPEGLRRLRRRGGPALAHRPMPPAAVF